MYCTYINLKIQHCKNLKHIIPDPHVILVTKVTQAIVFFTKENCLRSQGKTDTKKNPDTKQKSLKPQRNKSLVPQNNHMTLSNRKLFFEAVNILDVLYPYIPEDSAGNILSGRQSQQLSKVHLSLVYRKQTKRRAIHSAYLFGLILRTRCIIQTRMHRTGERGRPKVELFVMNGTLKTKRTKKIYTAIQPIISRQSSKTHPGNLLAFI